MRPTVAIKIPEVDEMMARAEQKVEAIRQAKQKVGELQPIDEVVFAQNVLKYNPEWEHSPNGRATSLPCNTGMPLHARVATEGQKGGS